MNTESDEKTDDGFVKEDLEGDLSLGEDDEEEDQEVVDDADKSQEELLVEDLDFYATAT